MVKEKAFKKWCKGCKFRLVPSACLECIRELVGTVPEPPRFLPEVKA